MALLYPLGLTSTDFSDGETNSGYQPHLYLYGAHIVIPSSGTVTQMGVKSRTSVGTQDLKFGLYDSGGALVVQSTGTTTTGSLVWCNSGTVSASVSAGTYYVLVAAIDPVVIYGYDTSGNGSFATEAYATAMQSSETITAEGDTGLLYGVRLDFTAAGGSYTLTANQGSYTLTGQATGTLFARIFAADQGSYTLSGQATTFSYSTASSLTAEYGLYTVVGSNALVDVSMNAEQGSYSLNGQATGLTYGALNAYTVTANQGSYTLTGQAATTLFNHKVFADFGTYSLNGRQVGLVWSGAPISQGNVTYRINISTLHMGL